MKDFRFGDGSIKQLATVKPDLQKLCGHALGLSTIDFGIRQGMRTEKEQRENVAKGVSQTMNSKHLTGDAIDFIPYWKGAYRDSWPFIYPVANAFMQASKDLGIPIVWGGSWGMDLWSFRNVIDAQEAYILLRAKAAANPFFDGFHIELTEQTTRAA